MAADELLFASFLIDFLLLVGGDNIIQNEQA
jgi:hypothetical protein